MYKAVSIFIIVFSIFFFDIAFSKIVSVQKNTVYLMSGPGKNFTIKWQYDKGFPLKVLSRKGKWVKVIDFEKDSGWIPQNYLSSRPSVIVKVNKNLKSRVNIHSGLGLHYKVIGKAFYGVVFYKITQRNGWTKVLHDSGLRGWIKSTLLWGVH